jgi:Tol biopolymer transport system component
MVLRSICRYKNIGAFSCFAALLFCFTCGCSSSGKDGLIVFTSMRDGRSQIYTMGADGKGQKRLLRSQSSDDSPWWSPDRSKVVFSSERDGSRELYIVTAKGRELRKLTSDDGEKKAPVWSPDGSLIAFQLTRKSKGEIYLVKPDGTEQRPLFGRAAAAVKGKKCQWMMPCWYPDSRALLVVKEEKERQALWKVDVATGKAVEVTKTDKHDLWPSVSAAGEKVLLSSDEGDVYHIYLLAEKGNNRVMLTNNQPGPDNTQPRWSTDGNSFVFVSSESGSKQIYRMKSDFRSGVVKYEKARRLTGGRTDNYDPCWGPPRRGK